MAKIIYHKKCKSHFKFKISAGFFNLYSIYIDITILKKKIIKIKKKKI